MLLQIELYVLRNKCVKEIVVYSLLYIYSLNILKYIIDNIVHICKFTSI